MGLVIRAGTAIMPPMRTIAILALCLLCSGCILVDGADLIYMATHHGRHIDEPEGQP